ncbi:MAG: GYF domain-containing protein [Myxococcota bacterium]
MKFLCGNCKAKYQIADEKIAGRTLRMKCRRCSHDIIIKGPGSKASEVGKKPAAKAGSKPAQAGSSLGADFRRSIASNAPATAPAAPTLDQWHVAINDVPVGPIRKAEIQRKISAGAVTGASLCWREGFDDWRPVQEVPELSALLRAPPPAPPRPAAVGRGISRHGSRPRIRPLSSRPQAPTAAKASPKPGPKPAAPARPAARSNVVPIGGRLGAAAAPAVDPTEEPTTVSDPIFPEPAEAPKPAVVAPPPPAAAPLGGSAEATVDQDDDEAAFFAGAAAPSGAGLAAASADASSSDVGSAGAAAFVPATEPRERRGLPVGAWIAIAGAIAFGCAMGVVVAIKFIGGPEPVASLESPVEDTTESPRPSVEPDLVIPDEEAETTEPTEETAEAPSMAPSNATAMTARTPRSPTTNTKQSSSMSNLTAEQRAQLERMRGSGQEPTIMNINVGGNGSSGGNGSGRALTPEQLAGVVSSNRPSLRRCYENAIRGRGQAVTVRVNVNITVGASGVVQRASATATESLAGLTTCVEGAVRRWRFPASGASSRTTFPVVFTGAS